MSQHHDYIINVMIIILMLSMEDMFEMGSSANDTRDERFSESI